MTMGSACLTVLADRDLLDGLISPTTMLSVRATCRATCRDLWDYLDRFLRAKCVRKTSFYESETVLGRKHSLRDLFELATVVFGQLEFLRSVSVMGCTCAGSFATHWMTEMEAMRKPYVKECSWLYSDMDIFCDSEIKFKETMHLINVFWSTIRCRRPIKWGGLGRIGGPYHCGSHHDFGIRFPDSYLGASEVYGTHPVRDHAAFVDAARGFEWPQFVASDSYANESAADILADVAACLPTKVLAKDYKVTRSVHATLQLQLPEDTCRPAILSRPNGKAWFTINLIRIVDVRSSQESIQAGLTSSHIIRSFDMAVSAVSMKVDRGLNIDFEMSPALMLDDLRTKAMRLTTHFLFGTVPPTVVDSPPRWDRRRDVGMVFTPDGICDRCHKAIPEIRLADYDASATRTWQEYAAVRLVLSRIDKYLARRYSLVAYDF